MKSFKKFVTEVAQPKPEEEKRFKDQHTYEVIKHPVATDAQFTGDIDKPKAKRIADQEGDANYDKAIKNPERRMAAESVNEEAEQIDEISKKLAGRYIKKAQIDTAHAGDQIATGSMGQMGASPDVKKGYEKQRQKGIAKLIRRRVGTADAVRKLTGTARVAAKEEVSEVTQSAIKKPMNITGPDGKVRTVMKKAKNVEVDDHGQEKIRENKKADLMKKLAKTAATTEKGKKAVTLKKAPWEKKEDLDEAVKVGNMKLKDGSSMKVTKEDAKLLNQMFKGLNNQNRKQMEKVMMTDKSGFNEIVGFAREAM